MIEYYSAQRDNSFYPVEGKGGGKFHIVALDGQTSLCGLSYRLAILDVANKLKSQLVHPSLRCNKNGCKQVYKKLESNLPT